MMNERLKKAVDFIADLTKQLITVSSGIVTVTLLFSKDIFGPKLIAVWAWVFYLASTVFGLWALMTLTGTLAPNDGQPPRDEDFLIGKNVRLPSGLQIITFGVAVVLTIVYVLKAFSGPIPKSDSATPVTVQCNCPSAPSSSINVQYAPSPKSHKAKSGSNTAGGCKQPGKTESQSQQATP
ncbi:MAG: hypothetical protein JST28_16145 [Acidobacteria bacterium]|nr:hypothetical protein [Acidobacteriota bacterium]